MGYLQVLEELSPFSLHQDQKSRLDLMLSIRSHAPRFAQLYALSIDACDMWGKKQRELSVLKLVRYFQALAERWMQVIFQSESRTAPFSHPCLYHRVLW